MNLKNIFKKKAKPTPVPYEVASSKVYAEYIQKIEDLIVYYIDNELGDKKLLIRIDIYSWLYEKSEFLKSGSNQVYTFENITYGQIGEVFSLPDYQQVSYSEAYYEEPFSIIAENEKGKTGLYNLLEIGNFNHLNIDGKDSIVDVLNKEIIKKYECYIDPESVYTDYFRYLIRYNNLHDISLPNHMSLPDYAAHMHGQKKINNMINSTLLKVYRYRNMEKDNIKGVCFLINSIKNLILHVSDKHMDEICTQNCPIIYWKYNKHKELKKAIVSFETDDGIKLLMETKDLIITYDSQRFWLDEENELEEQTKVKIYKKDCQTIEFFDCEFESSSEGIETLEMVLCGDNITTYNSFKLDRDKFYRTVIYRHDDDMEKLKLKMGHNLFKKITLA